VPFFSSSALNAPSTPMTFFDQLFFFSTSALQCRATTGAGLDAHQLCLCQAQRRVPPSPPLLPHQRGSCPQPSSGICLAVYDGGNGRAFLTTMDLIQQRSTSCSSLLMPHLPPLTTKLSLTIESRHEVPGTSHPVAITILNRSTETILDEGAFHSLFPTGPSEYPSCNATRFHLLIFRASRSVR
jgi:hypothetical protein